MFKIGDEIILIKKDNDDIFSHIDYHKIYKVSGVFYKHIEIYVDNIMSYWYPLENFISLVEYRKLKINKIKENICSK